MQGWFRVLGPGFRVKGSGLQGRLRVEGRGSRVYYGIGSGVQGLVFRAECLEFDVEGCRKRGREGGWEGGRKGGREGGREAGRMPSQGSGLSMQNSGCRVQGLGLRVQGHAFSARQKSLEGGVEREISSTFSTTVPVLRFILLHHNFEIDLTTICRVISQQF